MSMTGAAYGLILTIAFVVLATIYIVSRSPEPVEPTHIAFRSVWYLADGGSAEWCSLDDAAVSCGPPFVVETWYVDHGTGAP